MKKKPLILIIDDEQHLCKAIEISLMTENYTVKSCYKGRDGISFFDELSPDLVLTDLRLPDISGIDVLDHVRSRGSTPVVLMTAHASVETALEAMKKSAYDYILKPFNPIELKKILSNALELQYLKTENQLLKQVLRCEDSFMGIIGPGEKMQSLFNLIRRISSIDEAVLVTGESGTGKEMAARAIHLASDRSEFPFIAVNCGALAETLLESELFGHVKGAFTGADKQKKGIFEAAAGGTVFLDEIGEASQAVQVKLLRVLQEKEIRRVGESQTRKVDFRVIAATNRDLEEQVENGDLRQDLYYRLDVARVDMPPLRYRAEDVLALASSFAGDNIEFTRQALKALGRYSWPGNVRELQNVIKKAVIFSDSDVIDIAALPEKVQKAYRFNSASSASSSNTKALTQGDSKSINAHEDMEFRLAKALAVEEFEVTYLTNIMRASKGVISQAAQISGMDRSNFQKLLKKNSIDPSLFRESD